MKIKLLITLLFTSVISFLNAQNVHIPDTNFKNYLLNHTGINTDGDTEIQISEAMSFTGTMDCSYRGIADLTGIEAFVKLTILNCKYNQLTSLDISNNTALVYLDFRDNYLTTLDISNNTALRHLNTYYNPLTSLDVSNNLALTDLICGGGNQLTSLDVSNNLALTYLNCEINQLTSLDLSNNTALKTLSGNRNQLTSLDLSNNIHLTYMNCYFNQITCLDLSNNPALTQVYCFGNQLTFLNIQNGNNINMARFIAENNSELLCIQVDDADWSTANWTGNDFVFDTDVNFSEDCEYVSVNDYQEIICDSSNDEIESVNLTNYNQYLIENSPDYSFEYYFSENGALNQTAADMITSYSNYNLSLGLNTIYVRIDSAIGCHNMGSGYVAELRLILVSEPVVSIPEIVSICERETIILDAGLGFDSYLWSTGETSQTITVSQEGNYWVTVSQTYQNTTCSITKNVTVVLSNVATVTNIEAQDWTDIDNIITVNVTGQGDYVFSLDGILYQESNVFYDLESGYYTVYIQDKNGCGTVTENVFLLTYPKFFTPNGDGVNDTWSIKHSYFEPDLKTQIFDRYGKLLKELKHNESWDGKYNGYDLHSADYWFTVIRANGKTHKGHFTLKR